MDGHIFWRYGQEFIFWRTAISFIMWIFHNSQISLAIESFSRKVKNITSIYYVTYVLKNIENNLSAIFWVLTQDIFLKLVFFQNYISLNRLNFDSKTHMFFFRSS